jgi:hypothetical protein
MSNDLLDRLAADAAPVPRGRMNLLLALTLLGGVIIAAIVMVPWLGLRPDLAEAPASLIFWWKFAYTVLFASVGFVAAARLSRPGGSMRVPAILAVLLVAFAGTLGIIQLLMMPPEMARQLTTGNTALLCPIYIAILAVPIYAVLVLIMRRFAPTNLTLAGFAAGLLAGGAASWVYSFHCDENGLPFLAIWYTTGILIAAIGGAIIGRRLLRW